MTKRTVENDRLVDWLKIDNLPDNTNQEILDINNSISNIDNTSDLNKPVSTETQNALDTKQDTSEKGVANWYAGLDWAGKVPSSQLPDAGLWDMTKTTYDPQGIEADAFSMDNMVEGVDTKILTEAERIKLASVEVNAQENTINDVVAGTNITIDKTDPLNPIFNASWWIAPVDSVNWETGVVVLDTDDISEWLNKYVSQAEKDKLAWIEDNADVTDSTNVDSAGAVMESDYAQAKSILAQQSGTWSPEVVQVGSNELVGRTSGGASNIDSLSASEVRTILNVEDGATADQDLSGYVQYSDTTKTFTGTGDTSFAWDVWIWPTNPDEKLHILSPTNNTSKFETNTTIANISLVNSGTINEVAFSRQNNDLRIMAFGGNTIIWWFTVPSSKLEVKWGDIEVDGIGDWVIIKSPDGTRWRITIDNSGNLTTTSL